MLASGPSMRILHVICSVAPDWGGPSQVLRELVREQHARGHEVAVVATDMAGGGRRAALGTAENPRVDGVDLRVHRVDRAGPPYPSAALAWDVLRHATTFDVVHVHGVFNAPVSGAMWACRMRRVPYVLRPCGMLDAYSLEQRKGLKRAWLLGVEQANIMGASVIQVSTPHEEASVRWIAPRARISIVPQGVAVPARPGPRPHDRRYVLFLSRVARKKGLLRLVEAFATVARGDATLDLVIVGPDEGGHRREVEARVAELGIGNRVRFEGTSAGETKSAWFAHAECFVLPSDDENFGVVVVEAAHLGAPVIVSDQVGLAAEVRAAGAGLVVPREVPAIADAMIEVLGRGRAAYANGLARLAGRFAWPRLATELEGIYREVLAERAQAIRR